MTDVAMATKF